MLSVTAFREQRQLLVSNVNYFPGRSGVIMSLIGKTLAVRGAENVTALPAAPKKHEYAVRGMTNKLTWKNSQQEPGRGFPGANGAAFVQESDPGESI